MSTGALGKTKISVDTSVLDDGDTIGSYVVGATGTLITSTTIGSDEALDVNLTGLAFAEDTPGVDESLGIQIFAIRQDTLGTLVSADGDRSMLSVNATGALYTTVTSSALPTGAATEATLATLSATLTALSKTEDDAAVTATEGFQIFAVRQDTLASLVGTDGDLSMLSVDATGALYTTISSLSGQYAEDSVAADAAIGNFFLGVRRDGSASNTSAAGDYSEIQTWSEGSVRTVDVANNVNLQQVVTIGTTAAQLPTANLANRKLLMIQNVSNNVLYVGSSTVTADEAATGGLQIGKGGFVTVEAGPANAIFGRAATAGNAIAVWEFS